MYQYQVFFKQIFLFYVGECFACMYVYESNEWLVLGERYEY